MHAGFALGAQEALRGGHTHGEQLAALYFRETQVPMLFQQRHQPGQGRQEPFGTHIVCGLPGQKEGLLHRRTVLRLTAALDGLLAVLPMVEQLDGILATIACPFHKRVQQERFLGRGCLQVARSQMPEQSTPDLKGTREWLRHNNVSSLQTARFPWEKTWQRGSSACRRATTRALASYSRHPDPSQLVRRVGGPPVTQADG